MAGQGVAAQRAGQGTASRMASALAGKTAEASLLSPVGLNEMKPNISPLAMTIYSITYLPAYISILLFPAQCRHAMSHVTKQQGE
ncbi:MAG: hypothetical protein Q7S71_00440 [Candidatus Nitrotoga sp.]|nr:hypothetical protein [Candidatus Nitrotoga sp.]